MASLDFHKIVEKNKFTGSQKSIIGLSTIQLDFPAGDYFEGKIIWSHLRKTHIS